MKRLVALALAAAALMSLGSPVSASHVTVRDRNDVDGRLDLRAVEVLRGPPRKWILKTHKAFSARRIFDKGYLLVYFDTYGTKRFDYYVLLRPGRHKIKGNLWKDRKQANDEIIAGTRVGKPGKRKVATTVPLRKMRQGPARLTYRWHARTIFTGRHCKRVCIDRAPQARSVVEPFVP